MYGPSKLLEKYFNLLNVVQHLLIILQERKKPKILSYKVTLFRM